MFYADSDWQQQVNAAQQAPLAGRDPTGFFDGLTSAFGDSMRTTNTVAQKLNIDEAWRDEVQSFKDQTGRLVTFPQSPVFGRDQQYQAPYGRFRSEVDSWNTEHPDQAYKVPTDQEMQTRALARNRAATADIAARNNPSQTLTSTVASGVGELGAGAADPANIIGFSLFGAQTGAGILRAGLQDAVAGAAGQTVNEALTHNYRQQLDPNYSLEDSAKSIAETAAITGVAGAGLHAAGALVGKAASPLLQRWRAARDTPLVSRDTADAGNVVDHAENIQAANPFPNAGVEGVNAHVDAMTEAYRAASDAETPSLPPEADAFANETPAQTVDRQLRENQPDVMSRLDDLQTAVDTNKGALSDINSDLADNETFGPTRKAMIDAEAAQAKLEKLQGSLEKANSPVQQTQVQGRIDAVTSQIKEVLSQIDRPTLDRLEQLESQRDARQGSLTQAQKALDDHQAVVNDLRKQGLHTYWAQANADRSAMDLTSPLLQQVDRIRGKVDSGELPAGADIGADLSKAHAIVDDAQASGQPVGEAMAGLDHADGVNGRVRALVGLMHTGPDLAERVTPEEFTNRLSALGEKAPEVPAEAATGASSDAAEMSAKVTPEENAKAIASPDGRQAAIMDGMRLLAQKGDLKVPFVDGDGNTVMRNLSDVMHEADAEIEAAKELKACAIGRDAQ